MNQNPVNPPAPGLSLGDIYYVLFRHKWKIIVISALGIAAAALLPLLMPPPYQSAAKILIRYVVESKSPSQMTATDSRVKSPDDRGGGIINSEIEILTSLDVAQEVADLIGPEKILAKAGGGNDRLKAAAVIKGGVTVNASKNSSVIEIIFQHPDPSLVQPVLNQLVETYFKRHAEIHHPVAEDFLNRETDRLRSQLAQTESALRAAKTNSDIISLDEAKKNCSEQISKLQQEIFAAQAEMAQRQASLTEIAKLTSNQPVVNTNEVETNTVPPETVAEYKRVSSLLETLVKRDQDLSLQFTAENSQVKAVRGQIADATAQKTRLEKEFPALLGVVSSARLNSLASGTQYDLLGEKAGLAAIAARISVLTNQLAQVRSRASALDAVESSINELERKKELEEANYKYFSASREQSLIDQALGNDEASNISKIQEPTPPFRDSKKLDKMRLGAAAGGIAFSLALAFLIELYLDRSVRRSTRVASQLRTPLFVSVPLIKSKRAKAALNAASTVPRLANGNETAAAAPGEPATAAAGAPVLSANGHNVSPDVRHQMQPFFETLRDRLILFFEANNLTHKPKLVAVTGCEENAGVTTTAAGLAASLSETGEGNVLLVDMSGQKAAAHHFYKGRLDCGLEDALQGDKRDSAMVQENLYVVSESGQNDKLPQVLPKRFKHLIPKLRASDFDYIIFDMPPVSHISPTTRLAQFMDMVFLVVESEKTNADVAKHAASLLSESKANVGVVLNKTKTYVPKRLRQDL